MLAGARRTVAAVIFLVLALAACAGGGTPVPVATAPDAASAAPVFEPVSEQDREAMTVPAEPATGPSLSPYLLEIEDLLDISVYGEEDLQHVEVMVRPDGMISFTFIGDVPAAGRTIEDVRQDMTQRLSRYLKSPQVTVIAKQFAQKKVYIGGEVNSPGILYLTGREGTLLDALYKAGLVTEKASLENAYIMRQNRIVAADFKDLVRGNHASNVRLMDHDTIYVPEYVDRYVYVLGEVTIESAVETREPIPIVQAIARAGGFAQFAARDKVAVVRGGLKNPSFALVDAKKMLAGDLSQNIMVRPGDIIYVGLSGRGKFNEVIQQILIAISPIVQGTIVTNQLNP